MPYDDDEEPPPPKPAPPARPLRLAKHHNSEAPLAANDQKVLLELTGPSSAASRAALDLVAVIDISYSMIGNRLNGAKKALSFIVSKLTDRDRLSIVQFDDEATRVCPLRRVTEVARSDLEALISGLNVGGSTNIEAGLSTGVAVVGDRRFTAGRAANIMLLSDGQENIGNARRVEPGNVPVHAFGFGADHDSKLLGAIASKSLGGVYNFVPDSDDPAKLAKAFSRILAGLVTIVAQDLELTVTPVQGEATIKKVDAGTYPADPVGDGSSPVTVRFGTLSGEEARSVVVELALSDRTADLRTYRANVAKVLHRFTTAQGQPVTSDPELITIKRGRKVVGTADAPPPVETEVVRLKHVETIQEAIAKADDNKIEEAWNILVEALNKLVEARRRLLDPILGELQKELMKLLELFKTLDIYQKQGRHYAMAAAASHSRRRSTERGDEAAGPYDTERVNKYREQAQMAGERPPSSAAEEEEIEEMESAVPRTPGNGDRRTLSLALRLLTAVLSLLAISVMASARTTGWAGDYYSRYEPYRYNVGVNVIICFYSVVQASVETRRPVSSMLQTTSCYCITLFLDQASRASAFLNPAQFAVLAYLLMSASAAAASGHHLLVSRFGKERFNDKIHVAVWFSFLAFLTLSGNALISMANLFSRI
ncbi:hypothetical protein EJB05_27867, partial [Eragrostis curvula]